MLTAKLQQKSNEIVSLHRFVQLIFTHFQVLPTEFYHFIYLKIYVMSNNLYLENIVQFEFR